MANSWQAASQTRISAAMAAIGSTISTNQAGAERGSVECASGNSEDELTDPAGCALELI
jgi:hypothetical protein